MMYMEEVNSLKVTDHKIGVIGLGYVGLPLAIEFAKKFPTIGFDINPERVDQLKEAFDSTNEVSTQDLMKSSLVFSCNSEDISECNVFIITVPTPVDDRKVPDLLPIKSATEIIASLLKEKDIVIYESTVFPGLTEEVCVPILEGISGLKYNQHFFCGYSPERINPGDKDHRITEIVKVTSGSTPRTAKIVDELYSSIITAGTFMAKDIKTAEAAKVIENTQRDINIALVNELSIIFDTLGLDTKDVLDAAATKWNFLPFKPGLVGGHCIGVDPYYLTYKALEEGYKPEMILSGRKLNDEMPNFVANKVIELMHGKKIDLQKAKVLILGFSFKENCPDYRNTKIIDLASKLKEKVDRVDIFDPWVDSEKVKKEHNIQLIKKIDYSSYDAAILAVAHDAFLEYKNKGLKEFTTENSVIYDIKNFLNPNFVTDRL